MALRATALSRRRHGSVPLRCHWMDFQFKDFVRSLTGLEVATLF